MGGLLGRAARYWAGGEVQTGVTQGLHPKRLKKLIKIKPHCMGVGKNTTIKRPLLPIDGTDTQNTVQCTIKMIGHTMPYSQYLKIIREAVATDNVLYSYHARTRMNERGITRIMVTEALVRGVIKRPPERNTHGAIEVELNRYSAGMNYSVVVAVIDGEVVVTVVTVY